MLQHTGLWGHFPLSHSTRGQVLRFQGRLIAVARLILLNADPLLYRQTQVTQAVDEPKLRERNRGPRSHLLPYVCWPRE